jgi:hypothetical protein
MAYVQTHRDSAGALVNDVFDRVTTEGDAGRFSTAERGYKYLVNIDDTGQTDDGTALVTTESGAHLFQLPFDYIVGANQLIVQVPDPDYYASTNALLYLTVPSADERNTAAAGWTGPDAVDFATYFEEVGPRTVRVYGLPNPTGVVLFFVPNTSIPAASRDKVIVDDQGDNQAIELRGDGDGILLRSPGGAKFLVRVDDSGALVSEPR